MNSLKSKNYVFKVSFWDEFVSFFIQKENIFLKHSIQANKLTPDNVFYEDFLSIADDFRIAIDKNKPAINHNEKQKSKSTTTTSSAAGR